jgi:hypothetical protein
MCAEPHDMANDVGTLTLRARDEPEPEPPYPSPVRFGVPGFLVPRSIGEVKELARMIALAEWAPECYRDIDGNYVLQKIELAIMHGLSVGLGPIAAVQSIAIINGMPSIWGDGALAVIEQSGLLEDMSEEYEIDDEQGLVAICTMKRRHRGTPIVTRFSTAMADHAGLTRVEGPWQSYPERMLRMRARSWTMRDAFADVLRGLHLREEVEDYVGIRTLRTPAPRPERSPAENLQSYPSPRPKRTTGSRARHANGSPAVISEPLDRKDQDRPICEPVANGGDETYHLVDADGAVINVGGADALRARFEEIIFDRHLSPDQVAGVWESNEPARQVIARLFGAEALAPAAEHLRFAQEMRTPPHDDDRPEPVPLALNAAPRDGRAGHDQPAEPEPGLPLEINPIWGIQKVFQHYRAALNALAKKPTRDKAMVARFREANNEVERRLRAQLSDRMTQIDAIYQRAGLDT